MKQVLIICNGRPPDKSLLREYRAKADLFVAADGGGNIARDLQIHPDIVIGDLDSFINDEADGIKILKKLDQESNDLEKTLSYIHSEGAEVVNILGATGQRIDQTLKNLSVLKRFDSKFMQLSIIDDYGTTRLIPKSFNAELPLGTTVSLFPLSGRVSGIITKGLKYPLKNEALENGVRDGSSNRVVSSPVEITHHKGDLLMFKSHKKLGDPL